MYGATSLERSVNSDLLGSLLSALGLEKVVHMEAYQSTYAVALWTRPGFFRNSSLKSDEQ